MKVVVHPLVVAVALGLVSPDALEVEPTSAPSAPCEGCTDELLSQVSAAPTSSEAVVWSPGEFPSSEELHRVELEWLRATNQSS